MVCIYDYTGKDLYMGFSFFLLLAIDWMGGEEERVSYFFEGTRRDLSTKRLIGEPRLSGYSFPSTVRINRYFFQAVFFLPRIYERKYNIYRS